MIGIEDEAGVLISARQAVGASCAAQQIIDIVEAARDGAVGGHGAVEALEAVDGAHASDLQIAGCVSAEVNLIEADLTIHHSSQNGSSTEDEAVSAFTARQVAGVIRGNQEVVGIPATVEIFEVSEIQVVETAILIQAQVEFRWSISSGERVDKSSTNQLVDVVESGCGRQAVVAALETGIGNDPSERADIGQGDVTSTAIGAVIDGVVPTLSINTSIDGGVILEDEGVIRWAADEVFNIVEGGHNAAGVGIFDSDGISIKGKVKRTAARNSDIGEVYCIDTATRVDWAFINNVRAPIVVEDVGVITTHTE